MNVILKFCSSVAVVLAFNTWVAGCAQIDSYGRYSSYTPASQRCVPRRSVTYYIPSYGQEDSYTPNVQSYYQTNTKERRRASASRREAYSARRQARQRERSTRQRQETPRVEYTTQYTKPSPSERPGYKVILPPGVVHFQNMKHGDGFVPHVFSTDVAALLVWPLSAGDDEGYAAKNLITFRNNLQRQEPKATLEMILVASEGQVHNVGILQACGIRCLNEAQLQAFVRNFFSQQTKQSYPQDVTSSPSKVDECESRLDAIAEKSNEWGKVATEILQNVPWWLWAIGAATVFCIAYLFFHEDTNYEPIRQRNRTWVIDPSAH